MQKQHPCGHFNAPKVFCTRLQARLDSDEPALPVNKSKCACLRAFICIWFGQCESIATISGIHPNLPPRDPSSGLSSRELACIGQIVGKCCKIFQLFTYKTSCERRIAHSYVSQYVVKKISTSAHSYIAAY